MPKNIHFIKIPLFTDDRPRQEARFYTKNKITNCTGVLPRCVSDCHLTIIHKYLSHLNLKGTFKSHKYLIANDYKIKTLICYRRNESLIMFSLETKIPVHINVSQYNC